MNRKLKQNLNKTQSILCVYDTPVFIHLTSLRFSERRKRTKQQRNAVGRRGDWDLGNREPPGLPDHMEAIANQASNGGGPSRFSHRGEEARVGGRPGGLGGLGADVVVFNMIQKR